MLSTEFHACMLTQICRSRMCALLTSDEARKIAEDAYIFLYPVMENYKTMWFQRLWTMAERTMSDPSTNSTMHAHKLAAAGSTAVVTPNNDTLYSLVRF